MKPSIAIAVFITLILTACKDKATNPINNNSNVAALNANTNKTQYLINEKLFVTIKNQTADTVYFFHCNYRIGFHIELIDTRYID